MTSRGQGPTTGLDLSIVVALVVIGWGAATSHLGLSARNRPRAVWTAVKRVVQGRLVQSRRSTSTTSSICRAFPSSQTAALSPAPATPHPLSVSGPWGPRE